MGRCEIRGRRWRDPPRSARCPLRTGTDSARLRVVLFGGISAQLTDVFDDTWERGGTNWTKVADTGASPRAGAAMASTSATLILHGVFGPGRGCARGHLAVDGRTMYEAAGNGSLPPGSSALWRSIATDRNRVVLFGGSRASPLADTWEAPITLPAGPGRSGHVDCEPSRRPHGRHRSSHRHTARRPTRNYRCRVITVTAPGKRPARPVGQLEIPAGVTSGNLRLDGLAAALSDRDVTAPVNRTFTTDRGGAATLRVLRSGHGAVQSQRPMTIVERARCRTRARE